MELTTLVTRSLRKWCSMALFRPLCSSEVTSSTSLRPHSFRVRKQLLVGRLALDIHHLDSQDLPKVVLAERTNDQGALAYIREPILTFS